MHILNFPPDCIKQTPSQYDSDDYFSEPVRLLCQRGGNGYFSSIF